MKFNNLKQGVYLLILIVLPLLSFGNEQADALFVTGNTSYAKGHYKEALEIYKKILNDGSRSAVLYFNMGNACYKVDDIPSALLYYEKAHRLSPNDEDIKVNIRLANLKTTDKIEEAPEFFLNRWWLSFILSFSSTVFSVWSIVLVLLGSASLILYFFAVSPAVKRTSFYTAIVLFFVGFFLVFIAGRQVSYFENHKQGIVFSSPLAVKSTPAEQAKVLFVLHVGTKVNVLENNGEWIKIRLSSGSEGWVKQADLKEI